MKYNYAVFVVVPVAVSVGVLQFLMAYLRVGFLIYTVVMIVLISARTSDHKLVGQ